MSLFALQNLRAGLNCVLVVCVLPLTSRIFCSNRKYGLRRWLRWSERQGRDPTKQFKSRWLHTSECVGFKGISRLIKHSARVSSFRDQETSGVSYPGLEGPSTAPLQICVCSTCRFMCDRRLFLFLFMKSSRGSETTSLFWVFNILFKKSKAAVKFRAVEVPLISSL